MGTSAPTTQTPAVTFTLLSDVPSEKIDRCAQMLPNKLQCYRPGFWLVTESSSASTTGGTTSSGDQGQQKASGSKSPSGAKASGSTDQSTANTKDSVTGEKQNPPTNHPTGASPGGQASVTAVGTSSLQTASDGSLSYQLCNTHKIIMEQAQKQAAASGESPQALQAKMLGDAETYRLTHMPIAPEEKHKHAWLASVLESKSQQGGKTT